MIFGSTNSDPVDAKSATVGVGLVSTGTGMVCGEDCVAEVVE